MIDALDTLMLHHSNPVNRASRTEAALRASTPPHDLVHIRQSPC